VICLERGDLVHRWPSNDSLAAVVRRTPDGPMAIGKVDVLGGDGHGRAVIAVPTTESAHRMVGNLTAAPTNP
jgi:hypothetical protein